MNYQKELEKTLEALNSKPRLLLHACCGPCSSYVLETIASYFETTIIYYNPNIYPEAEYSRRLDELKTFLPRFTPAVENKIRTVELNYNPEEFYEAIKIKDDPQLAHEEEKGERCRRCYYLRLKKTYDFAVENSFDYFCTTLSISPFKDSLKINTIGEELTAGNSSGPKWLYSDFKKKGGFQRSLELSREYDLYRQQYCGCVYSRQNADAHRNKNMVD